MASGTTRRADPVPEGEGRMEADDERRVVPPGVRHAIHDTGRGDLLCFEITPPPDAK